MDGARAALQSLAAVVVLAEGCALLSVSFGLFNIVAAQTLTGTLLGYARSFCRKPQPSLPPAIDAPSAPDAKKQDVEVSTASLLEPVGSEVSFTFNNALALGTAEGSGSGELEAVFEAVAEGNEGGGEDNGEEDEFEDCSELELVFEPSSSGLPGMCMLQRGISGLAVRTEPTSHDTAAPLLVSSYEARIVEVVNGRVSTHAAQEPSYVDEPCAVAAHSPRRTANRLALGAVASISPGSSSAAL